MKFSENSSNDKLNATASIEFSSLHTMRNVKQYVVPKRQSFRFGWLVNTIRKSYNLL